jgi:hypothetical protein
MTADPGKPRRELLGGIPIVSKEQFRETLTRKAKMVRALKRRCGKCGKAGHTARNCPEARRMFRETGRPERDEHDELI